MIDIIDIKALRIGSHVEYKGKRVRVALVRDDGCICEYKDNGQDVNSQKQGVEAFAREKGWTIDKFIYDQVYDAIYCDKELNSLYRKHGQLKIKKRK